MCARDPPVSCNRRDDRLLIRVHLWAVERTLVGVRVIAEFGQSHRGSLSLAKQQASEAKSAGCWAIKWQVFAPERIASKYARRYWNSGLGGSDSQLQTFADNGMLLPDEWRELFAWCQTLGIEPMATPFDLEAVDLLAELGVSTFKIASGDITYGPLLEAVNDTGKDVILSTGASTLREIDAALRLLDGCDVTLLACTLAYPTGLVDAHLGRIPQLAREYTWRTIGYSDHTLRSDTALAAACMGAKVLEKHCTLSPGGPVPDDNMALSMTQLRQYVAYAHLGEQMRGQTFDFGPVDAEQPARTGARRSGYATRDMVAGETITPGDVAWLRPADSNGFSPMEGVQVVGRPCPSDVKAGDLILRW